MPQWHHSRSNGGGNGEHERALPRNPRAAPSAAQNTNMAAADGGGNTDTFEFEFDAVIIPGGGVEENGLPKEWVVARLDEAAKTYAKSARYFVVLSRGTTHKPPPADKEGFPVDEVSSLATAVHPAPLIARARERLRDADEAELNQLF